MQITIADVMTGNPARTAAGTNKAQISGTAGLARKRVKLHML